MATRLSASSYLFVMSLAAAIWAACVLYFCGQAVEGRLAHEDLNFRIWLLNALFGFAYVSATPGRLRDLNFPSWTHRFAPLSFVAVVAAPLLLFYRGDKWDNDYGEAPEDAGCLWGAVGYALFALAVVLVYTAAHAYPKARLALVG